MFDREIVIAALHAISTIMKNRRMDLNMPLEEVEERTEIPLTKLYEFEEGYDFNLDIVDFLMWAQAIRCELIFGTRNDSDEIKLRLN